MTGGLRLAGASRSEEAVHEGTSGTERVFSLPAFPGSKLEKNYIVRFETHSNGDSRP